MFLRLYLKAIVNYVIHFTITLLYNNYVVIISYYYIISNLLLKWTIYSLQLIAFEHGSYVLKYNVNVSNRFQAAIKKYGVPEEEIFQTADLFERRNIPQVTLCLYALARMVSSNKIHFFFNPSINLFYYKM